MVEPPRGRPTTQAERLRVLATRMPGGSDLGGTRNAKQIPAKPQSRVRAGSIEVVFHGADGTVARPTVAVVWWVGAATPANAELFDAWYPATI